MTEAVIRDDYEIGRKRILEAISILRGNRDISSYDVILYLLSLYRYGVLSEALSCLSPSLSTILRALRGDGMERCLLSEIYRDFSESMERLDDPATLCRFHSVFSTMSQDWYDSYYPRLFDDMMFWLAEHGGKRMGEYVQPAEVTKLVCALSGYNGEGKAYNPYAGAASYAIEASANSDFIGDEIHRKSWGIGVMRLMAHGLDPKLLRCSDSYNEWRGCSSEGEGEKFDYIISSPPFSMPLNNSGTDPFRSFRFVEDDLLCRGALSLEDGGTLTGVFAPGVLSRESPAEKGLRMELIDAGIVSKVIWLPPNLFYGTKSASVIVQLKNEVSDGTVTMMDASSFFKKEGRRNILRTEDILSSLSGDDSEHVRTVSVEEIAKNDYSLTPSHYLVKEDKVPDGYVSFRVGDVVSQAVGATVIADVASGHVLDSAIFQQGYFVDPIEAKSLTIGSVAAKSLKMDTPFIAISRKGALRPTMVVASVDNPVFLGADILAFKVVNAEVFPPLLAHKWRRKLEPVPMFGVVAPSMSPKQALDVVVHLPASLDEQRSLYLQLEDQGKRAKEMESDYLKLLAGQRRDFTNLLRARKHDLMNCLGGARNSLSALTKFIDRAGLKGEPLCEYIDTTVGDQLDELNGVLKKMGAKISHFLDEDAFGEPEKVDLNAKLLAIQSKENYTVEHEFDLTCMLQEGGSLLRPDAFVKINGSDFDRMIDNIIGNAEVHGFKDHNSMYTLKVALSYDISDRMYVIEFKNNGLPMPNGMDTMRYGIEGEKGEDSKGSGMGGMIVKGIVEHFGGKYEVYNEPDSLFPVEILIKLPRYEG